MNAFGILVFMLAIGVPMEWFWSEFQGRRLLRQVLGKVAILLSFCVAAFVGASRKPSH